MSELYLKTRRGAFWLAIIAAVANSLAANVAIDAGDRGFALLFVAFAAFGALCAAHLLPHGRH